MNVNLIPHRDGDVSQLRWPHVISSMQDYLPLLCDKLRGLKDPRFRYLMVAHLFDDTQRMLDALEPTAEFDAIFGVPYSSNRTGLREAWTARFGDRVHITQSIGHMERRLTEELAKSLALCRKHNQQLIVQEVGGFVTPLLHTYFRDQLNLVRGVVEITKQGVWRAEGLDLKVPVLHCADSEMKRFEAKRCGETLARCLDGIGRELGLSLAGRQATVMGAGWIGSGLAGALKRLDMVPVLVDTDPLRVVEARLDGFIAARSPERLEECHLVAGATGRRSITAEMIRRLPDTAILASGSSRQVEIDVDFLRAQPSSRVSETVEAFHLEDPDMPGARKSVLLVNDGYPANFIPGSGSVPDEIVETILGELIVLMTALEREAHTPGIHRITPAQEAICAELWLELRDRGLPETVFRPKFRPDTRAETGVDTLPERIAQ